MLEVLPSSKSFLAGTGDGRKKATGATSFYTTAGPVSTRRLYEKVCELERAIRHLTERIETIPGEMTIRDACRYARVSRSTIYNWQAKGILTPLRRPARVRLAELQFAVAGKTLNVLAATGIDGRRLDHDTRTDAPHSTRMAKPSH